MIPFDGETSETAIVVLKNVRVQVPTTCRVLIDNFTFSFTQVNRGDNY